VFDYADPAGEAMAADSPAGWAKGRSSARAHSRGRRGAFPPTLLKLFARPENTGKLVLSVGER